MKNMEQDFKKKCALRRQEEIKEIRSLTLKDRLRIMEKLLSETPPIIPDIKERMTPVALSSLIKKKYSRAK